MTPPPADSPALERTEKYWICEDCATAKGWSCEGQGITMIRGLCGWCDRVDENFLIPTRDFRKQLSRPAKEGGE